MNPSKPPAPAPTQFPTLPGEATVQVDDAVEYAEDPQPEGPFEPPDGVGFSGEDTSLVELAKGSPEASIRAEAALELRYRNSPAAIPTLVALLADANADVRLIAVEGLADLEATDAIGSLEAARDREDDDSVAAAMGHAIEELGEL